MKSRPPDDAPFDVDALARMLGFGLASMRKVLRHRDVAVLSGRVSRERFREAFPELWDELEVRGRV